MIASHANAAYTGPEKRSDALLDAEKRVLDRERIHREVAKVSNPMLGEGIHLEDRVPRTNDRGLHADMTRPEARSGTIGCPSVKGDTDESDPQLFWPGYVRQTQEGGYAGETSVGKSIERLGMGQPKAAAGLRQNFGHGRAS